MSQPFLETQKRKKILSPEDTKRLWDQFKKSGGEDLRNQLVEHYLPQVKYAADRLIVRLPSQADYEDLLQTGVFGLIDAIERFDPAKAVRFETYCYHRIMGSMLDGIRAADWVPRLVRKEAQRLEKVWAELETELGREPSDYEVAQRLGMNLEEYDKLLHDSNVTAILSYNVAPSPDDDSRAVRRKLDSIEDRGQLGPIEEVQRRDILETLARMLTKKERLVIILYYYEQFTFKEIGEVLEVTESRICQIHSKVIAKLKAKLARIQTDLLGD